MPKSSQYTHYFQRIDEEGFNVIDIENSAEGGWDNLLYMKTEGLNDIGKAKNVYIEQYADSDKLRCYLPENGEYANEATKITMHFLIVGDMFQRQTTLKAFSDYIRVGIHRYWDDARNLEFDFIVQDEIKVSDEKWHGSTPYVEIQIVMQNLNGKTREH